MLGDDDIFNLTLYCLRWHAHAKWGDSEPIDVFNRLLAKNIRPRGWTPNTHLNIHRTTAGAISRNDASRMPGTILRTSLRERYFLKRKFARS